MEDRDRRDDFYYINLARDESDNVVQRDTFISNTGSGLPKKQIREEYQKSEYLPSFLETWSVEESDRIS
jgi:predicted butyrate kinase (DUF1464 family)